MNHLSIPMNFINYMIPMKHKSVQFFYLVFWKFKTENCSEYMKEELAYIWKLLTNATISIHGFILLYYC